jgi:RNA polymerase sigma-70 factor (ECF subfamily)
LVPASQDRESPPSARADRGSRPPDHALEAYLLEFDYLCRSLQRLGVRHPDIEDLAHEVFLVLSRKWCDYNPSRPLRPYIFGVAFRIASQYRRRQLREVPCDVPDVADPHAQPDTALSSAEARALVLNALEKVPLARRAVFVMHDLDETPMREIAKSLHIPLFTAYSRLRKARQEFERAVTVLQRDYR